MIHVPTDRQYSRSNGQSNELKRHVTDGPRSPCWAYSESVWVIYSNDLLRRVLSGINNAESYMRSRFTCFSVTAISFLPRNALMLSACQSVIIYPIVWVTRHRYFESNYTDIWSFKIGNLIQGEHDQISKSHYSYTLCFKIRASFRAQRENYCGITRSPFLLSLTWPDPEHPKIENWGAQRSVCSALNKEKNTSRSFVTKQTFTK